MLREDLDPKRCHQLFLDPKVRKVLVVLADLDHLHMEMLGRIYPALLQPDQDPPPRELLADHLPSPPVHCRHHGLNRERVAVGCSEFYFIKRCGVCVCVWRGGVRISPQPH